VKRSDLEELAYITAIENLGSILTHGILSFRRAQKLPHTSIAMDEIQKRRAKVIVPGGRHLHEYACVYICGRNPMLYKRRDRHKRICVVRVSPEVLDLQGVVVTNGNASSEYVRFAAAPSGLRIVERELTFSEWWTDEDPIEYYRKKVAKCAEVLVPDRIEPRYLLGAHVSCEQARELIRDVDEDFGCNLNPEIFFL
jgi:ssDNA thymidine ADP-ribosyltransferase, DarT